MNSSANVDVLLGNDLEGLSDRKEHRFEVEFVSEQIYSVDSATAILKS